MLSRLTLLSVIPVTALTACATQQENPYYKYSSKYKGSPVTTVAQAPSAIQAAPVSYQTASHSSSQQRTYTRVNHECLRKEKNRELLGAGLGGTVGAIAGKKLIGGTKGTVIGAGLGGAAGYGIGDKLVNCDPQTVVMQQPTPMITQPYVAPVATASYATPTVSQSSISPTDSGFESISGTGTPGYQVMQAQTQYEAPAPTISAQAYGTSAQEVAYDYSSNTVAASTDTIATPSETRILTSGNYGSHIVKQGDTVYSLSRKHCVGISDIQSLNNLDAGYSINIGDTLRLPASNC